MTKEVTITPLGTISPYTKGNMNCPGFLIEYESKKLLLDAGNGITRLLNFPSDLKDLSVIISHYHKDHYGDLGLLQYASYVYHNLGMLDNKIKIYLPEEDFGNNKSSIISNNESYSEYIDINDSTKFQLGDLNVSFKDNNSHTVPTYMVKLHNNHFKIIYTSDVGTTNMEGLVAYCKDADLIICESSFLKRHNSSSTTHLTAIDAGKLAKYANAKRLLLTHFWPEEDKRNYLEEAKQEFENTIVAEEGQKLVLRRVYNGK